MLPRILVLLLCAVSANAQARFFNRTVTSNGVVYHYVVSVPADWSAGRSWPMVLFLHGSNERGDDGVAQSKVGLARAVREHPERFPAIVVMPQCRPENDWTSPAMEAQILAALDASSREFHGDPQRTYLTGFSMGGYGTWALAAKYPKRFAAIVVVAVGFSGPRRKPLRTRNPMLPSPGKSPGFRSGFSMAMPTAMFSFRNQGRW